MRTFKRGLAIAMAAAVMVSLMPSNSADAAKKIKLNKSKTSVKVGKTVKLTLKNAKKTAKVTWKTSSKKTAKITKMTKKGNAYAIVKGVKAGKATITATVKTGKKTNKATCVLTVKSNTVTTQAQSPVNNVTQSPVPTQGASAAPTNAPTAAPTEAATKAPKPTKTPKPSPTPEPTRIPIDSNVNFDAVKGAVKIDNSTYVKVGDTGNSKYIEAEDLVEVNDPQDQTHGAWTMPEDIVAQIVDDTVVSFRVQGFFKGSQTVRFWIGTEGSGGCTPIELVKEIEDGCGMGDNQYPACFEEDGTEIKGASGETTKDKTKHNQMLLNADATTGKFDVSFNLKAGTSQNDCGSVYSNFTLKGVIGNNIDGLVIKNIYITAIDGVPVKAEPTEAPATEAPATEAPATEAPATEAPATEAPATEAPATEAPATEAPATEAPATEAPATEAPADVEEDWVEVDLSDASSYVLDGNDMNAVYDEENDELIVDVANFQGIIFKNPAEDASEYKYVTVCYRVEGAVNAYYFDGEFTDGKGEEAAGQVLGSTFEAGSDDWVTYKAETSMEAVKFVRIDTETFKGTKLIIESIEFSKVDPDAADEVE